MCSNRGYRGSHRSGKAHSACMLPSALQIYSNHLVFSGLGWGMWQRGGTSVGHTENEAHYLVYAT